jgi:hypothetical protein
MEVCYGGTDVMEKSCAVARGIDIDSIMCYLSSPPQVLRFPLERKGLANNVCQ